MIEKTILDYLSSELTVAVKMEMPEDVPASFVLIEKTGESMENKISRATLAIQSYGPTLYDAASLCEDVNQAMDDATVLPNVSMSQLNSSYNYTDQNRKLYRYQSVYNLVFKED